MHEYNPSDPRHTAQVLLRIYEELIAHYGPLGWWPSRSGSLWEIMLGAVLVQRTSWNNVEKSLDNIEAAWGLDGLADPEWVIDASESALAELVRPSGHYNSKPQKLKNLARYVENEGGTAALSASMRPTSDLRRELLAIWGIGPETADAVLLYALGRPIFVADAYAQRLASRWGLLSPTANYNEIQAIFMDNLPHNLALFGEYHALIVEHGKEICRPQPHCEICPLNRPLSVGVKSGLTVEWQCPKNNVAKGVRV